MKRFIFYIILIFFLLGFNTNEELKPYIFSGLEFFPTMPLPENNFISEEGVSLGRMLFYDPILSRDSTFSCSSCHQQKAAFSDANQQFSTGISGDTLKRNTQALFNLAWYPSMFWDGKVVSIEEQVFHPVRSHEEMDLDWNTAVTRLNKNERYIPLFKTIFGEEKIDSLMVAKAIAQFERTLISNQSKYDRVLRGETYFTKDEYEGFVLINDQVKGDCLHCHTTDADPLGTSRKFSNNGLDAIYNATDYKDKGKGGITGELTDYGLFKIPSLRNIAVTGPYMHDGRFESLEEVLDFYSEEVNESYNVDSKMSSAKHGGVHLTKSEKEKIIIFLHTLTDSTFLNNREFSNPF